jgi:hypothetical protein
MRAAADPASRRVCHRPCRSVVVVVDGREGAMGDEVGAVCGWVEEKKKVRFFMYVIGGLTDIGQWHPTGKL